MALFQVVARSQFLLGAGVTTTDYQYLTLADAVAINPPLFHYLQCDSLAPHDFALPDSHLQTLLGGQVALETLALRMGAPLNTQDQVHGLQIAQWQMVALRTLQLYGIFPRGLGQLPNGMGNEFSNLTSLTLGRVDGLYPPTTVSDFFAAVSTWQNLRSLEIEQYSHLMLDPEDLSQHVAHLPELLSLTLADEPTWIAKFLTYAVTPRLSSLHLRTVVTISPANPSAFAAVLTSWLPQDHHVLAHTQAIAMLRGVRKVEVRMGENEFQPTRIVGATLADAPLVSLEVQPCRPVGMDDATWRDLYAAWSRSSDALGAVVSGFPHLFSSDTVSTLDLSGNFDGVLAEHWCTPLRHYPGLAGIKINARGGHGADGLFPALTILDREHRDLVCSDLDTIDIEGARYSGAFLKNMLDMLVKRVEAPVAYMKLHLTSSCAEYKRDFPKGDLMATTSLNTVEGSSVGSFNLRISDWNDDLFIHDPK